MASSALGSDPATGGKGAEQAAEKAGSVATQDKHKVTWQLAAPPAARLRPR